MSSYETLASKLRWIYRQTFRIDDFAVTDKLRGLELVTARIRYEIESVIKPEESECYDEFEEGECDG